MITIEVNGRSVSAEKGEMLLTALRRAGIKVPTLCHIDGLTPTGACRMCVVEVEGQRGLVPSCAFPAADGMKVRTHSPRAVQARKTIIELLLANHPDDCLYCVRNGNCELQAAGRGVGRPQRRFAGDRTRHTLDTSSPSIVRDPAKCILCGKCVRVCEEIQRVAAIDFIGRGSRAKIGTAFDEGLNVSSCVNCGQCVTVCPTGALTEQSQIQEVIDALNDKDKLVVVQHAPAVSVTLGEEFGLPPGHRRGRRHDHRPPPARLRPRLRHLLRRRPDDHGRRLRAGPPADQRRQAADAHQLLAGLDQVRRDLLSRLPRQSLDLQEPAADDGRGHQELFRPAATASIRRGSTA